MEAARLRASPEQFSALIEFMERNGDLSRPLAGSQGRLRGDRLWQELTSLLNSIGGGVEKTQDKWKKVWADWKTKTKKKYMMIRRHASGTGGGPSSRLSLTALEERVVAIIGVSAVIGQAGIQEQGFNIPSQRSEEPITEGEQSDIVLEIQDDINITPPPRLPSTPLPILPATPPLVLEASTSSLPPPPPPPPPRTPPRSIEHQASISQQTETETPRRRLLRARRNRGLTPFDRAASEFVAVEQSRLRLEEARDRRMHEVEMERLRLESQRIEVTREHNELLRQLCVIAQGLVETLSRNSSLTSTVVIPEDD